MLYGASNGHMINDVTWPQKVKVVTPISLEPNISETLWDRDLVPIEHQYETSYGESNRHVIDDVTWPWEVKVVTQIYLESNSFLTLGFNGAPIGNSIWGIESSRDQWRNMLWPQYVSGSISYKRLETQIQLRWSTYSKWYMGIKWSLKNYARWRHVTLQVLNNYAGFDHKCSW